ncbi:MAG: lipoprotein [Aeromonadaceae bacterium]|nr:lipoprotein [Aeromonadaceae bacterium]MBP9569269.1 lipoprotein [Aeromonadaceae bacterium]
MLVSIAGVLLLTGCGLKGPLTIPKEEASAEASSQQPAQPATQPAKE